MSELTEVYLLTLSPDLGLVSSAVDRLLSWAVIQGYKSDKLAEWRLALTEGIVNAIKHGCAARPNTKVELRVNLLRDGIEFLIRDSGHFSPGPAWSQLPEDPLSESGRGGFLIAQSAHEWAHENSADGHTLVLRWRTRPDQGENLLIAGQAALTAENLTGELANAYEMIAGYSRFFGLLATARDFADLLQGVRSRLAVVVPHTHFILRFVEGDRLILAPGAKTGVFPASIALTASGLESGTASSGRFATVNAALNLGINDPLAPVAGPLVVLPVIFAQQILGTLVISPPAREPLFTAGQIELLQSVADFIGIAHATDQLNRSREGQLRLQQDIAIAAGIQRLLLPQSMPVLAGWKLNGSCRPAREVGGDYFDFIPRPDGSVLMVIADVMGKGVPAALVATMLRTALRAHAAECDSPGHLLTLLNQQLSPDLAALEVFITALLIRLPATGGTIQYANAGHCPPLLLNAAGLPAVELSGGDMPLGVLAGATTTDHIAEIPPGGHLFAFTDGCFEWRRGNGSFLGSARFSDSLIELVKQGDPDLVNKILDGITAMVGPAGLPDDCTLVTIQRTA